MQVKKPEEKEILRHLSHVVEPFLGKLDPKDAIEDLRVILEYPDLDASDAKVFREAISKLEGVISTIDAVKEALGKTELSKKLADYDALADGLPPGFSDRHPDDPGPETIIGQVSGKWVVHAWVNYHYSAIKVDITGGKEARKGVDVGDRSITIAGDDWRSLVTEAATEMQFRTGLPVRPDDTLVFGVAPVIDDDGEISDSASWAIAEEAADILARLAATES